MKLESRSLDSPGAYSTQHFDATQQNDCQKAIVLMCQVKMPPSPKGQKAGKSSCHNFTVERPMEGDTSDLWSLASQHTPFMAMPKVVTHKDGVSIAFWIMAE